MAAPSAPRPPRPRKEPQPLVIPRSAAEEQRLRLERLMRNPVRAPAGPWPRAAGLSGERDRDRDRHFPGVREGRGTEPRLRLPPSREKTVPIPEKLNEWAPRPPPEFVRDVMGSSAGAGSGEFHVYRHLRRREYQRQDFMDAMAEKPEVKREETAS
ncbi:PRKR-interacting protein 1 isoform X3 [Larus michahellis]|uniref:PRKR-interacting protein 1 isoform X3 n=1 Tax=Larus michahellis TaxID=119627 RepID=UPI003D9B0862